MSQYYNLLLASSFAVVASYTIHLIWMHFAHASRAKKLGCQPAIERPHRLPLGIDIIQRTAKAINNHVSQSDDVLVYEELGKPATWRQNMFGTKVLVTVDPANIQAMLATKFKDFELGHTRRGSYAPFIGDGIFTSDGKFWHYSRSLLRPQFSRSQISDLQLEEKHVQNLLSVLKIGPDSWTAETDLAPLFFNLTMDSATEFLFGESIDAQIQDQGREATRLVGKPIDMSGFSEAFDRANVVATFRNRLVDAYYLYRPWSWKADCKLVQDCADYYVGLALKQQNQQQRKSEEDQKQESEQYVFLEALAKETQDPIQLRGQILNILVAGRDTTAGLLGWTFYLLARHPAIWVKLREAVLDAFGPYSEDTCRITFETLKGCTYLQQVMSEVLRLHPLVPENIRTAVRDTTLPAGGGPDGRSPVYVRSGESVLYNVHVMQRREDLWGDDAGSFRPERWEGHKPGWEYLPFNGGPRICIGQQFALTEAGYVIVRLMQRYDRVQNMDFDPVTRHRYTSTTSPLKLLLRLHAAEDVNENT